MNYEIDPRSLRAEAETELVNHGPRSKDVEPMGSTLENQGQLDAIGYRVEKIEDKQLTQAETIARLGEAIQQIVKGHEEQLRVLFEWKNDLPESCSQHRERMARIEERLKQFERDIASLQAAIQAAAKGKGQTPALRKSQDNETKLIALAWKLTGVIGTVLGLLALALHFSSPHIAK